MILTEEKRKILKDLNKSQFGVILKEYLEEAKKDMNNVKTIETIEELKGRQFALKVLDDLFAVMKEQRVDKKSKNLYT